MGNRVCGRPLLQQLLPCGKPTSASGDSKMFGEAQLQSGCGAHCELQHWPLLGISIGASGSWGTTDLMQYVLLLDKGTAACGSSKVSFKLMQCRGLVLPFSRQSCHASLADGLSSRRALGAAQS